MDGKELKRIALGVEYSGNEFHGWQTQKTGVRTVQSCVETALSAVANHPVNVICAGRTDHGVHARLQIIHADVTATRSMRSWVLGGNSHLPNTISLLWAKPVDHSFHARFSATARHYHYIILNRLIRPALLAEKVTWVRQPLAIEPMQIAGNYLIGTHDFTSYRATACQAHSPVRTLKRLTISKIKDYIIIEVSADGFLYHMVRNIAGILISIGSGEKTPQWAKIVLEARDRAVGGMTAPAHGLYFCGAEYPPQYELPNPQPNEFLKICQFLI